MGGNNGRVLRINNLQEQYSQCQVLAVNNCPIYGQTELVRFNQMNFNIAHSHTHQQPHPMSLHYLVQPDILIFPQFTLLQDISPAEPVELFNIIESISEMASQGESIGVGYRRLGFNKRWGIAGQLPSNWAYEQVYNGGHTEGVFFSPQMMISLSQKRRNPRYDTEKADVFALGVMLVEIIFGQPLGDIYDYDNFEIRLNPLLEKLQNIRSQWGNEVANLFICMLEIEEEDRVDFGQLNQMVRDIIQMLNPSRGGSVNMLQSGSTHRRPMEYSRGNRTPGRQQAPSPPYPVQTPKNNEQGKYRNDVSPFRGRFGGAVKNGPGVNRRTPERINRSPMRRNLQGNSRPERETFGNRQAVDYGTNRNVSPTAARAYY